MKKICLLFLLVLLLLTACTPAQNSQTSSGDMNSMYVHLYRTVSEYENFLTKFQLPPDFVHLDSIPNLGSFAYFYPYQNFPNKYHYSFRDGDDRQIDLYVTHNAKTEQYPEAFVTSDMTSMRRATCKERSVIKRNGVEYHYNSSGYIMHIIWHENDIKFLLYADWNTKSAPLISRLMSISETEAAAAFAEIKQSLDAVK